MTEDYKYFYPTDVLVTGYNIKSSEITDEISSLSPSERDRIYSVVNAMIKFEKSK